MFLYWGPELVCFYNDAFRPSLGSEGKHPGSLGKPGSEFWTEAWHEVAPLIARVMAGGEATWSEDQLIPIYRNGKLEDVYWTYSSSPVFDESGAPGGVLVTCYEPTQQVLALARFEESTDELSFAIEATELATFDVNPLTNKLKGNKRLKEWFGLAAHEEVDLQTALDVIAEEDRPLVTAAIQRAYQYASGGRYDIEYAIVHPLTRQHRYVKARGRVWFNDDREAYRFNGTLQDVTTEVMARKRLEESEQQVHAIIESSPFPISVYLGREMRIQFANKAMKEAYGKGPDVTGKRYRDLMPELEDQVFQQLERVFETGIPFHSQNQAFDLVINGQVETHYYTYSFTPLVNTAGGVYGIVNTAYDVTDLVLARQKVEKYAWELQESEQRFRSFVQASNDTLYRMSPDWQQMLTLEGNDFLDFTNQPKTTWVDDYLPPEDQAKTLETINEAMRTRGVFELEHRVIKADGTVGWTFSRAIPVLNEEGEIIEWFGAATDITEQKLALEALQESEHRFRIMADAAPNIIWVINPDASIKCLSENFRRMVILKDTTQTKYHLHEAFGP